MKHIRSGNNCSSSTKSTALIMATPKSYDISRLSKLLVWKLKWKSVSVKFSHSWMSVFTGSRPAIWYNLNRTGFNRGFHCAKSTLGHFYSNTPQILSLGSFIFFLYIFSNSSSVSGRFSTKHNLQYTLKF